jgi:hypothetical protein
VDATGFFNVFASGALCAAISAPDITTAARIRMVLALTFSVMRTIKSQNWGLEAGG